MNYIPESVDEIDQIVDINLKGVIYGTHIALPYFQEQKKGSIINTSSGSGLIETNKMMTNTALYASTKAGINLYSFCAAQKLPKRIRINSMMPGWTKTDIVAQAGQDINNHLNKYFDVAEPEEIVPFYTFYASDESKRITGALVNFVLLRMAVRFVKEYMDQPSNDWKVIGPELEKYSRGIYRHVRDHVKLLQFLLRVDAKGSTMMPR
jgi:NAD(P)-dependent dehydrogenase (short-subunit alcohol dehydrogenase family)